MWIGARLHEPTSWFADITSIAPTPFYRHFLNCFVNGMIRCYSEDPAVGFAL
jgi:hypothetical protein